MMGSVNNRSSSNIFRPWLSPSRTVRVFEFSLVCLDEVFEGTFLCLGSRVVDQLLHDIASVFVDPPLSILLS